MKLRIKKNKWGFRSITTHPDICFKGLERKPRLFIQLWGIRLALSFLMTLSSDENYMYYKDKPLSDKETAETLRISFKYWLYLKNLLIKVGLLVVNGDGAWGFNDGLTSFHKKRIRGLIKDDMSKVQEKKDMQTIMSKNEKTDTANEPMAQ